jgi:2-phosphosulfolactate phosphatase
MEVTLDSLLAGARAARGIAVVVDVYRAFTCAPLLFSLGLERSILVADPEKALDMKKTDPDLVLIGEVKGVPIQGFDLGNSPSQILKQPQGFFMGRTAVQRTSSGVQGALAALEGAEEVLLGSYTLARAVSDYIRSRPPYRVSIVAMGIQLKEKAPEDEWCARFIAHLLGAGGYDHNQAMREILFHQTTQKFLKRDREEFPSEDPLLCLQPNVHDFVLRAAREGDQVVVRRVSVSKTEESTVKGCCREAE